MDDGLDDVVVEYLQCRGDVTDVEYYPRVSVVALELGLCLDNIYNDLLNLSFLSLWCVYPEADRAVPTRLPMRVRVEP